MGCTEVYRGISTLGKSVRMPQQKPSLMQGTLLLPLGPKKISFGYSQAFNFQGQTKARCPIQQQTLSLYTFETIRQVLFDIKGHPTCGGTSAGLCETWSESSLDTWWLRNPALMLGKSFLPMSWETLTTHASQKGGES